MADHAMDCSPDASTSRYEDVPAALTAWVRTIPDTLSSRTRYVTAGGLLVAYYLGGSLLETDNAFLRAGGATAEWQAASRLVSVAEALFLLRRHGGFPGLVAGLRGKDLRSIFFEVSIARRFAEGGFEIGNLAVTSGGFRASIGDARIDVVMLGQSAGRFSAAAVGQALQTATEALSGDAPAFLCCFYPESWRLDCWDIDFSLGSVGGVFFSGKTWINRIGFYREEFSPAAEGTAHMLTGFTECNPSPKHPAPHLDAVLGQEPVRLARPPAALADEGDTIAHLSFFDWVDWVLATRP